MRIFTTPRFESRLKNFVKAHSDLGKRTRRAMSDIAKNPFADHLKTHKLSGQLKGCYSARITYGHRVVFIIEDDELCFIDIGSHDKVY